jgi:ubiquitin carboxyl-terminal hydrolase 14
MNQIFRAAFPQFAQKSKTGVFMQQDAEECWTQLITSISHKVPKFKADPNEPDTAPSPQSSAISQLFMGQMVSK